MALASALLHRDLHQVPHQVLSASGVHITLSDGKKILDATGGAAVSCLGHGNERVLKAMTAQMSQLDYCHSMFFSCPSGEELATFLTESTNGHMTRALIVSSGR